MNIIDIIFRKNMFVIQIFNIILGLLNMFNGVPISPLSTNGVNFTQLLNRIT